MTDAGTRVRYEFDGFQLDIQQRLLMSGAERRPVPLPPKIFDTLLYMVERRGELLDKTTLLKAIWPNVVVEENSLNQNISTLRRVLGDNPAQHRYIVTEPGRGYRFVADVRVVTAAPTAPLPERIQPAPEFSEILNRRMIVWYVHLGALDQAYSLLEESLQRFARLDMLDGLWSFLWLREMTPFRQDARFQQVTERFGLMPYWERFGPPDGHELRRGKLVVS